jgi:hypothetical protein
MDDAAQHSAPATSASLVVIMHSRAKTQEVHVPRVCLVSGRGRTPGPRPPVEAAGSVIYAADGRRDLPGRAAAPPSRPTATANEPVRTASQRAGPAAWWTPPGRRDGMPSRCTMPPSLPSPDPPSALFGADGGRMRKRARMGSRPGEVWVWAMEFWPCYGDEACAPAWVHHLRWSEAAG